MKCVCLQKNKRVKQSLDRPYEIGTLGKLDTAFGGHVFDGSNSF